MTCRRSVVLLLALSLGLAGASRLQAQQAERRVALVIGNGAYQRLPKLANPANDARDLAQTLQGLGFSVTTVTDGSTAEMEEAVRRFSAELARDPTTAGVFFYAGHAVQSGGENYLIPVDADIRTEVEIKRKAIWAQEVLAYMNEARNRFNMVILDACRDNPFAGSFRSATRGLAVVGSAPPETIVVYATGAGATAEDGAVRNSPFTAALLKHIGTPGLDAESMLRRVTSEVQAATSNRQTPYRYSSLTSDFRFAGGAPAPVVASSTSSASQTGELYVTTEPSGAEVTLDGERKGTSPLLIKEVPVGRRLRVEARSGSRAASAEVTLGKAGLQDLSLALQTEKGNLVIVSTGRAVRVALDGRALGELGSGLFRDVEAGSHTLELAGTGVYWKGEVTVAASTTAEVKAEPYAVGEIVYDIPWGAEAAVSGQGTSQTARSSGKLVNLKAGRHEVVVSGGDYDTVRLTVDLSRGQSYELKPYRTGTVVVESTPSGATVTVGGAYRGTTPVTVSEVPAGSAAVEVSLSGYTTEKREVAVSGGKRSAVGVTLAKAVAGPQMVLVEGGTFQMGAAGVAEPVHSVTVSGFSIAKYEVTQKEWVAVMGSNPSYSKGDDKPVEKVSWFDAVDFCNRLSVKEGLQSCYTISGTSVSCDFSKSGYRLPTEAEWEYAAKGGRSSRGYTYAGGNDVGAVGWYDSNSGSATHAVGGKRANELGLYDMSGNVLEWCWDWYGNYSGGSQTGPRGPSAGSNRVLRGGSWGFGAGYVRVAFRSGGPPSGGGYSLGFRPVRTP